MEMTYIFKVKLQVCNVKISVAWCRKRYNCLRWYVQQSYVPIYYAQDLYEDAAILSIQYGK